MVIKGVLFDFDGTLTAPGSLDFAVIRKAVACPAGIPILEYIESLPSESERREAHRILDEHETEAARMSQPNEGAEELLCLLKARGIPAGIVSRNSLRSILTALEGFKHTAASDFSVILSRDDPYVPKPSPEGIRAAAGRMGVPVESLLVVGDFIFDIQAGAEAGATTAYLSNGRADPATQRISGFTVGCLAELQAIIRLHAPLAAGKLPNDLLAEFLPRNDTGAARMLIGPGVGEDIAAVEWPNEEVLILKSDPITFATDAIGYYAVIIAANDIATCGGTPRWLLTTMLFPVGTTAAEIHRTMQELHRVAGDAGMTVCGGHTEITDAVSRPVIVSQAVATTARSRLIDKRNMRRGDRLVLTKGLAIEGASILAREFPALLKARGLTQDVIGKCREYLYRPGISILREAGIAAATAGVTAMHDVTEGGLATALEELSVAGRHRLRVYRDRIAVLEEARQVCSVFAVDPLGLIGSGSLLITCAQEKSDNLICAIREAGVQAAAIGEVLEQGAGIEAVSVPGGTQVDWPHFEVDEIARIFAQFPPTRTS